MTENTRSSRCVFYSTIYTHDFSEVHQTEITGNGFKYFTGYFLYDVSYVTWQKCFLCQQRSS